MSREGPLNKLASLCHNNSVQKGFWAEPPVAPMLVAVKLCLVHSEVSEALEVVRKCESLNDLHSRMDDKLPGHPAIAMELADVIIRVLDLSAKLGLDIDAAIQDKMSYNSGRPQKHGKVL